VNQTITDSPHRRVPEVDVFDHADLHSADAHVVAEAQPAMLSGA